VEWGTTILSGGLGLGAILLGSTPLGWVAGAVGVLGWLISSCLEDRHEKVRKAQQRLKDLLYKDIDERERKLRQALHDWFYNVLFMKQLPVLMDDLLTVASRVSEIANSQRVLAWTLNERQKKLNRVLISEALKHLNASDLIGSILDIARIPGFATMFLIRPVVEFSEHLKSEFENLMSERIWFIPETKDIPSLISQVLGNRYREKIRVDNENRIVFIDIKKPDKETEYRMKLVQQLIEYYVTWNNY
jgi:hypothetical protein